jgi:hypothetical protein
VVHDAVMDRNTAVEDRLDIKLTFLEDGGRNGDSSWLSLVSNSNIAFDGAYDIVAGHSNNMGALTYSSQLLNLLNYDYLDFTMPWWPQAFLEETVINDVLYSVVESSAYANLTHLHGTFFNNRLIEAHGLKSPYEYVYDNTWTFDNMMTLIKDVGYDMNNNGSKDKADYFGLVTGTEAKIETWFFGMGYRYAKKNASGGIDLLLSDSNKMIEWIDRFNAATAGKDFLIYDQGGHTTAFFEERAVLYMTSLVMVNTMIDKEMEMDYGVVPVPKGSESQERYYSNVANHHAAWCVPLNVQDFQESTVVIECLASESYRTVAPVYFDTCVKLRYAPDERLYEMYDIIRDSMIFDFCQIYSFAFNKDPRSLITSCTKGTANWASQWASLGTDFENGFASVLALYGLG